MKLVATALCMLLMQCSVWAATAPAVVVMDSDILIDYERFLAGRNVHDISDYSGSHSRRDVIEVVLLNQMLKLGGYQGELALMPEDSYRRILHKVGTGAAAVTGTPVWAEDALPEDVYITEAIVREGEFVVGLYTSPNNKRALAVSDKEGLKELSAVSTRQWRSDWRTLKGLQLRWVYDTFLWPMMVKMVWAGRADITLAPFQPNESMSIISDDITLVPIPNIKVALQGSRHWIISRQHPQGKEIFSALRKGVKIMRKGGRITRAYIECGFFDPRVENWKLINR